MTIVIPTVELNAKQEEAWDTLRAILTVAVPHLSFPFYELLSHGDHRAVFTQTIAVAATDGVAVLINPGPYFGNYTPGEQLFVMCHEILHCLLDHPELFVVLERAGRVPYPDGSKRVWLEPLAQWAADYVVNAILVAGNIGQLPKNALYEPQTINTTHGFFDAYRILYDRLPKDFRSWLASAVPDAAMQQKRDRYDAGTFDRHLRPGTSTGQTPSQVQAERNEAKRRAVIAQSLDMARQQGRLPQNLERVFAAVLEPKVAWEEKLHATLSRVFTGDRWSYETPDDEWMSRDIFVPGRSGFGAADVIVGGDVSGSVSDFELAMARAEIGGILAQIKPRRLIVLWCDARIHDVHVLEDAGDLAAMPNPHGGGGTRFVPVFEWVEANRDELGLEIDGLVYITDGEGEFPKLKPDYPVIWALVVPPDRAPAVPFGEVVHIPQQARQP